MSLSARLVLTAGMLALGLLGDRVLCWHLDSVRPVQAAGLLREVSAFPERLEGLSSAWEARPDAGKLPALHFADETLVRTYRHGISDAEAQVYLLYSHRGEDRKHHPEYCLRDAQGLPEDAGWRQSIALDKGKQAVRRYRFRTGTAHYTFIYYWHYAMPPEATAQSPLQMLHWRVGHPVPSLTVLVCTDLGPERVALVETDLLRAVDVASVPDTCRQTLS